MRQKLRMLALVLSALPLPGHGEDLLDVYREARANDPVLSQAQATRLATSEGVTQARALMLPQLNGGFKLNQQSRASGSAGNYLCSGAGTGSSTSPCASVSTGTTGALTSSGHKRTRTPSLTLTQSVLDLSQWANLSAAKSLAGSQDATYVAAVQNLYVRVTAAYFGVLTSQDALVFAKANEDAYQAAYDQAEQRFQVGLSAVTDVYQAKSYYELAKARTIAALNALSDARETLTQITGKPVGELKKLREDLPMVPPNPSDPEAWVQAALQSNATVQASQSKVGAAEHSINAARAGHLPTINASVSRSTSTSWLENGSYDNGGGNGSYGNTTGLTLNLPIFAGGATQSRVRQSIYQRDAAQDSLETARRQVVRTTLNFYRSVSAGISQVEANKASVDSGQKALEATRAGFDVGTQTMLNVLNAIQTLTQAESSYSQSRHQLVLDQLQLKQSAGSIDVKDVEMVNSMLQ
ncbi:TolC family outer membrane protein [Dyella japonica]|uniref:Type I secretion protein TolC n=1 Tax=Dyella japonica DSM 16301 TaxID=1440762 RepID=A0A0G9H807_9GAMM|nr:TolC family outer membrane protein [Dyella japonica]KLD65713.1 type I secretion protein TolC [Dyella japonica DSM 16301]